MPYHRVKAGECVSSLALKYGHFGNTIWMAPENAELRRQRKNGNVLQEGDEIFIPEIASSIRTCTAGARHRFKRKGVPSRLEVQLLDAHGDPIAAEPYRLDIDGQLLEGSTDGEGWVRETIPPDATDGRLMLDRGDEYQLALGYLDPLDSARGFKQRLANIGYATGDDGPDELGPGTLAAVRLFRADRGMSVPESLTESVLAETREKLEAEHYS
jgi:hypothetical protein